VAGGTFSFRAGAMVALADAATIWFAGALFLTGFHEGGRRV
jgi:hypothetical protein